MAVTREKKATLCLANTGQLSMGPEYADYIIQMNIIKDVGFLRFVLGKDLYFLHIVKNHNSLQSCHHSLYMGSDEDIKVGPGSLPVSVLIQCPGFS